MQSLRSGAVLLAGIVILAGSSLAAEPFPLEAVEPSRKTYPNLSPDSRFLIYSSGEGSALNIYRLDLETKETIALTNDRNADSAAAWSPDGQLIVFQREYENEERDVWIMNADGTDQRNLTDTPGNDQHPRFSPDQKHIVFDSNRDDPRENDDAWQQNYEIYIMPVDGGDATRLTNWGAWDMYPSLSPDGRKLAWRRTLPIEGQQRGNFEIFVKDLETGVEANISTSDASDTNPHWSPTGEWIVFASNRNRETGRSADLYIVRPDGSDLQRITDGGGVAMSFFRPSFSADGEEIVANRMVRGVIDMVRIRFPEGSDEP